MTDSISVTDGLIRIQAPQPDGAGSELLGGTGEQLGHASPAGWIVNEHGRTMIRNVLALR